MIRIILLFSLMLCSGLTMAQGWSVGGYLSPSYGNIVRNIDQKNDPEIYDPTYNSDFKIGGGLMTNYYKNRWMMHAGLNFKKAGAFRRIPITTVSQPDGNGSYSNLNYSIAIMAIPVGINYRVINKGKFTMFCGIDLENGLVFKKRIVLENKQFDYKNYLSLSNGFYFGIMPQVKMEWNLSERKFLFSNVGLNYQFNTLQQEFNLNVLQPMEEYRINNLFMDIGFAYRLKK